MLFGFSFMFAQAQHHLLLHGGVCCLELGAEVLLTGFPERRNVEGVMNHRLGSRFDGLDSRCTSPPEQSAG